MHSTIYAKKVMESEIKLRS